MFGGVGCEGISGCIGYVGCIGIGGSDGNEGCELGPIKKKKSMKAVRIQLNKKISTKLIKPDVAYIKIQKARWILIADDSK